MKVIQKEQLQQMGALYVTNVLEGILNYSNTSKTGSEKEILAWLTKLANEQLLYADFYVGRIGEEAIACCKEHLDKKELEMLRKMAERYKEVGEECVYLRPDDAELRVLVALSYRELLFSTFYVPESKVTIWSNFGGEFLISAKNIVNLNKIVE